MKFVRFLKPISLKLSVSYLIPHIMHLLKAISHGCGANWKDILQLEQAPPTLQFCLLSTNNAVALSPWYIGWLVMIQRPRLYRHAFQLKIGSFNKLIIGQNHYPFHAFVLVRFC